MKNDRTITLTDAYFGELKNYASRKFTHRAADSRTRAMADLYLALMKQYPPDRLEKQGAIPEKLLDTLKKQGFFGISIPEKHGGLGFDIFQYPLLVETIAANSMSVGLTVLAHLSIGVKGIVLFGNDSQKARFLPPAAAGETIFSYALTEPETGSDARNIRTSAEPDGDGYVLNGAKTYITNANIAGAMTVFARLASGEMAAFIVETGCKGVAVGREMPKMGLEACSTAMVRFNDVRVPRENLLGKEGEGFKIAMTILNHGRLALGAASTGMMELSLRDMVERSTARKQFGVPISSFELIREKLVRAKVHAAVGSAMTFFSAEILHENPLAPAAAESSHCKLFGTTRAWDTLYDALQIAGGAGYLRTLPYERRMRDFRVATIFEGTTEIHSIYPALLIARKWAENLFSPGKTLKQKTAFVLSALFPGGAGTLKTRCGELKPAVKLVYRLARKISLLTALVLSRHKRQIEHRQFFLRRISFLSMYCFGVISMISRIETGIEKGKSVDEDLEILRFLTREAREFNRCKARWLDGATDMPRLSILRTILPAGQAAGDAR